MRRRSALSGMAATLAVALLATLGAITASTTTAGSDRDSPVIDSFTDPLPPSFEDGIPSSPLTIVKTADVSSAAFGDEIEFRLYVHNETSERVPALVFDPIAEGTRYIDESYGSEPPGTGDGYDPETNAIYWQGNVEGGATVVIEYKVRVVRCDPHGFNVTNVAVAYAYGQSQLPASNSATVEIAPCKGRDLGDAPDSSNHFDTDMSAYPGVPARFPTVFDHDTGAPPGPLHRDPSAVHLGRGVSFERDADVPPDQDGFTNLLPIPHEEVDVADVATLSGIANLDGFDDGLRPPEIPPCGVWEELPVVVTVNDPTIPQQDGLLYLNIWVDGNHNGRWGDAGVCASGDEGFEWVLQDLEIPMGNLVTGTQVVTVPTTLPVLREPSSDGGVLPAWMRVTLSESPAPRIETPHVASVVVPQTDGRGPKEGWELGETEDYYLPGTHRPPVAIDKSADKDVAALGDEIEFTITLTNPTTEPAKVLMYDPIPEGTEYISDTFTSSVPGILEGYNEPLNAVLWQGFVPGNQTVVITFRVQVVRCHPEGSAVLNTAWAYDYEIRRATAASVGVKIQPCVGPDLGDAPDSTNHYSISDFGFRISDSGSLSAIRNTQYAISMTAYPGVPAEFPTVFDPATGAPPGPLHHNAYAAHLGDRVSFERDADQPPDQDGVPNLRPQHDQANLDRYDDAFPDGLPAIAPCESWTELPVAITVNTPVVLSAETPLYLNMWVDGNHNGRWDDINVCGEFNVSEWVLQNHEILRSNLSLGTTVIHVNTLPVFRAQSNDLLLPAWLRITLSDDPQPVPEGQQPPHISDGSGPASGWDVGETEDYYLPGDPAISIDKAADRTTAAAGDEIKFTVTLSNGSGVPARVTMYDLIPPGTEYIPNSYVNVSSVPAIEEGYDVGTRPDFGVRRHWIVWRGDVPANGSVVIKFRVRVVRCDPEGFKVINDAWAFEPGLPPVSATAAVEIESCRKGDVGDAPDSSNHFPGTTMTAYAGVDAHFPTVFQPSSDPAIEPPGPMHWRREAETWLGRGVSSEHDADLLPDEDGKTNLDPPADKANRDWHDDGLILLAASPFPHCQPTEISVVVTVAPGASEEETPIRERYINAWFDWNRDGDWEDAFDCDTGGDGTRAASLEWAVRDHLVRLGPGTHVVTLPAFLPYNDTPTQGLWARITLAEEPAPVNETTHLADGRGPDGGYHDGETEDYLIPGRSDVVLRKAVDKQHTRLGAELTYTLTVQNGGDALVADAHVEDPIPDGTSFVGGSLWASKPEAGFTGTAVTWDGDLEAGETVTISFKVQVAVASSVDAAGNELLLCARVVRNRAELTLPDGVTSSSNVVATYIQCPDLGDAPDSSNHYGVDMTAYGTVTASFPTVFQPSSDPAIEPPGPIHWKPLARAWLGYRVSGERDADLMPDEDGRPNLDPVNDRANRDRHDDGLVSLTSVAGFPHCEETTLRVLVNVAGPSPTDPDLEPIREMYINAWFDWNRNGDWKDELDCEQGSADEWAVRDYKVSLPPGLHVVELPAFLPYNPTPDQDLWARITLSEEPTPVNPDSQLADGRGPDDGYKFGETEDYRFPGQPSVSIRKVVDTERASLGAELTYTLTVQNNGSVPLVGVHVEDPIPAGTSFVNGSLWASKPVTGFTGSAVTWDGDLDPGETVTIGFKVKIRLASTDDPTHMELECEGAVRNHAVLLLPDGVSLSSNVAATRILCPDLGDAPDSSNHFNVDMTAYGTVAATFPTVFQPSSDPATEPPGPIHWQPRRLAWLGYKVSGERDADLMPDEDGRPNLDPVNDSANRDRHDDSLVSLTSAAAFPHCEATTVRVLVNLVGPSATDVDAELIRELYINAWFDWNRDGDWEDAADCAGVTDAAVLEWAVRDYQVSLPPGLHVVALPAFLPHNPTPDQDLWARITLSEAPAPVNGVTGLADGRGPDEGYRYGETEDYLIPGRPAVDIHKTVDLRHVGLGGALTYTVTVHNGGNALVTGVEVKDAIPEGTRYISGTLQSSKPTAYYENGAVHWTGDVEANETVTISFQVRVAALDATLATADLKCERVIRNYAVLALPNGISYTSNVVFTEVLCPDLGDAPDSTNHFNVRMSAYSVVTATFPTVFQPSSDPAIEPPGPLHWQPRADAWLGYWVSGERDADLMPDEDGRPNLKPPHDDANLDRADDGLVEPVRLPHCEQTKIKVRVNWPALTATADATIERYINVWFDWNRDGDWEDAFDCADQLLGTLEWAVRDYLVTLHPGLHEVELPAFLPYNPRPNLPTWARVTLAEQKAPVNSDTGLADGRGPDAGYRFGETEDYLIPGIHVEPEVKIVKRVNKLHAGLGEKLEYTILVENGGPDPVTGAHVEDEIPDGTTYVPDSLWASKPVTGFTGSAVTWDGDILAGETVTISFKVQVKAEPDPEAVNDERCGRSISNRAVLVLPAPPDESITIRSNEVHTRIVCPDLGDAPDSSNHHGASMTTYPGNVPANFPTVFDAATGLPQGPRHLLSTQDAWLGPRDAPPTGERDADLMPDEDGRPNIYPPDNKADQDEHDNGVFRKEMNLQHCEPATFKYEVTIVGPQRERFVNAWFDWNRDGDWEDELDCPNAPAPEWAVQNQVISLGPGTHVL
ncbi:MAG: GEVED domain-containing protein, partial [Anaerolineae bacterium]